MAQTNPGFESAQTTNGTSPTGPLSGVTVLEVGVFIAAPFATTQLADLGARVIKVEPPKGGDPVRSSGPFLEGESSTFIRMNRNKESIALDLKSPEGKKAFLTLLDHADVLIENLRPGSLKKMGLGYDDLKGDHPGLIYASVSGWGQTGPLAKLPGLDIMAQGRSGLMSITGFPDMPPAKVGVPICDLTTALYATIGILSALYERKTSGQGQYIDVSLFESAVSLAVWEAGAYYGNGSVPTANGSAHQALAPYQAVQAKDGYVTIGANTQGNWERFCTTFDFADLADDPDFVDPPTRMTNRTRLISIIEQRLQDRTVQEVVDALNEAGVPVGPISKYDQVFTDEHLASRDYFWTAPHAKLGDVEQLGNPINLSRSGTVRSKAGPMLGEHNVPLAEEFDLEV
ncbi:CoA transferase [Brevibacterium sp. 91QC2O2]|uniref:CaiB/BaiF CoA transferase family protein n=1 Tax=Brevibacterium TaxID=1696 RepID=UPI00211C1E17|nr:MULTISPECIES: CoA transferase [unclassified Brevibacterium]MCQ9367127.1 CoA transferase [Brevibacterium sp. 91QC2O2]MCQ9385426.1 CoA transferase [Brevibacterium sp. 68QC2CO]